MKQSAAHDLMKLVVDGQTDRVRSYRIVGEAVAEITQAGGIAVKMKATKADFDATIALHRPRRKNW